MIYCRISVFVSPPLSHAQKRDRVIKLHNIFEFNRHRII